MNGRQRSKKNHNRTFQIQPRQLVSQTSRKKFEPLESDYQLRYEQLEKILIRENYNLKEQNEFLLREIRKITKKEKTAKQQLQQTNSRNSLMQDYISRFQKDFCELKNFIKENIQSLIEIIKKNDLEYLKKMVSTFIVSLSEMICLQLKEKLVVPKDKGRLLQRYTKLLSFSVEQDIKQMKNGFCAAKKQNTQSSKNKKSSRQESQRRNHLNSPQQSKQSKDNKKTPRFSQTKEQPQFANLYDQNDKHKRIKLQKAAQQMQSSQNIVNLYQRTISKSFTERQRNKNQLFVAKQQKNRPQNKFVHFKLTQN